MGRKRFSIKNTFRKVSFVSVVSILVVAGILLKAGLSTIVVADGAGADGDGNAWGGVAYNSNLFISTNSAAWKSPSLDDIAAGNVNGVHMNGDGSITIDGFNGTGGFHASGATITCPAGTTNLYMYSLVAQRDAYGYKKGDLVGLMGMDGNSSVYNSNQFGGGTRYDSSVPGALSFSSVSDTYNDLYNQGLVHVGWGNGNGLSWFCSAGDGAYTPSATSDPCTRGVSAGYTTVDVKVNNTRLRGTYSGWRQFSVDNSLEYKDGYQVTYAMPTDEIQWAHCYNPGVQLNYGQLGTNLTKTIIDNVPVRDADPDWFHGANVTNFYSEYDGKDLYSEPSNKSHGYYGPEISTMRAEMNARHGSESNWWKNQWWITRSGNISIWSPNYDSYFEYNPPQNTTSKQTRREYNKISVGNVGQELVENDETGTPRKFVVNRRNDDYWNGTTVKYRLWEYDHTEDRYSSETDLQLEPWTYCRSYDGSSGSWSVAWTDEWYGTVYSCHYTAKYSEDIWKFHPCRGDSNCRSGEGGSWRYKTVYDQHGSSKVEGELETWHAKSSAKLYVPYNFQNTAVLEISGKKNGDIVYAGDEVQITKAAVQVNPVPNSATEATYATIVRNPKAGFIAYVTSNPGQISGWAESSDPCANVSASVISGRRLCESISYNVDSFNSAGNLGGVEEPLSDVQNKKQMVFDANAGDYMCYAVAVYPSGSGSPTNWSDPEGNHQWAYSNPMCLKIAKVPYFGVYGGSVYSAAKIATAAMGKTNIFNDSDYDFEKIWNNGMIGKRHFGSFAEQSVFGINAITGLASGSAYLENIGISNNDYCNNLVPITFANAGNTACNGSNNGAAGFMGEIDEISVDKDSYVDFWLRSSLDTGEKTSDAWGESTKYYSNTGKNIYYTYINNGGNVSALSGMDIPNSTTRLVKASGDIEITGNIRYSESDDSHKINSAGDIPQVIIYANNISIRCDVTQIDAILIAKGAVNTCSGASIDGYINGNYGLPVLNNPNASHPLTIRGVVIADYAYLYRTYGAAVDGYSGTPAETINYDSSSLLWARYMAGASESNTMTEVYRTELAPRY